MTVLRRSGTGLTALAFVAAASALASGQAKPSPDDTLGTLGAGIPMPQKWTPAHRSGAAAAERQARLLMRRKQPIAVGRAHQAVGAARLRAAPQSHARREVGWP